MFVLLQCHHTENALEVGGQCVHLFPPVNHALIKETSE